MNMETIYFPVLMRMDERDANAEVRGHGILSRTKVGRTPSQHTHKVIGHSSMQ